jgi:hypothetical protein
MIRGKYIYFDIDSSIVEKKSRNIMYMQYFHETGNSKKKGCVLALIWDVFVDPARPEMWIKVIKKNYLLPSEADLCEFRFFIAFETDGQTIELSVKQLSISRYR